MPVEFKIEVENRLVIATVTGQVSGAELLHFQDDVAACPDLSPDFDAIFDCRDLSGVEDLSGPVVRQLASRARWPTEVIVIARGATYHYGLSRMFQLRRTASNPDSRVMICESIEEARGLLGRDPATAGIPTTSRPSRSPS